MSRIHDALKRAEEERGASIPASPTTVKDHGVLQPDSATQYEESSGTMQATRAEFRLTRPKAHLSAALELPYGIDFARLRLKPLVLSGVLLLGAVAAITYYRGFGSPLSSRAGMAGTLFEGIMKPAAEFNIATLEPGTVRNIFVQPGDSVKQEQLLVTLDSQQAKLALREAQLKEEAVAQRLSHLRVQLAESQASLSMDERSAAQVPTRQWRDSPERAQAAYDQAVLSFGRAEQLFAANVIAKQELEARSTDLRIAKDDLQNSKSLAEASAQLTHQQAKHAQVEAEIGRQEQLRQLREAGFAVDAARQRVQNAQIRATGDGLIVAIPIRIGDQVSSGTLIVRLARMDRVAVEVPIAASLVNVLQPGQRALVTLPTLPPRQVEAKVKLVNPIPNSNMTHIVEVEFENPASTLLAGQPAQVRFPSP